MFTPGPAISCVLPPAAEPVQAERVSGGFFQTLGVHPMLGRDFNPGENRLGGPNVAAPELWRLAASFWARRDAVGQTVDLDNTAYTIIGVLPRVVFFAPGGNAEFWVPLNRSALTRRCGASITFSE